MTIDALIKEWLIYKEQENDARRRRIDVEAQICKLHPPKEEGSMTVLTPEKHKVSVKGVMYYKVDLPLLLDLTRDWPVDTRPVKSVADETKLRAIRLGAPLSWRHIVPAVTMTPGKAGIEIKLSEVAA
jgi:hypothetical protein